MRESALPRIRVPARSVRILRADLRADGRIAYPGVVQYQLYDGRVLDLPPDGDAPYRIKVHDLIAYDRLRQAGALEIGHRLPTAFPTTDNRTAPGA